jgi:hypothetical protein
MPRRNATFIQMDLPGLAARKAGRRPGCSAHKRILLKTILQSLQASESGSQGLIEIYRDRVLPVKTRTIHLLGRKCSAKIIHTLLGFEVQASYKRIQCPDMVTARYLRLFTELGCRIIKLPYDPTLTARLVPDLEAALEHLLKEVRARYAQRQLQLYVTERLFRLMRRQLVSSAAALPAPPADLPPQ